MSSKPKTRLISDPWAQNRGNIFSAPWAPLTIPHSDGVKKRVTIKRDGISSSISSALCVGSGYFSVIRDYSFLCNVVTACAQVRGNWDYKSSQQIIPVFLAANHIAKVLHKLEQERPKLLQKWWDEAGQEVAGPLSDMQAVLQFDWTKEARKSFAKRHKKGLRARYYKYNRTKDVVADTIENYAGEEFLFFSPSMAEEATADQQIVGAKLANQKMKTELKRHRAVRYAYWSVVLESTNAFMHLDENNIALPQSFPRLMQDLRMMRPFLEKLVAALEDKDIGYAVRLREAVQTIKAAEECFKSKKDRNLEFESLSTKERSDEYKKRRKKYDKRSKRPDPQQMDLFGGMELDAA